MTTLSTPELLDLQVQTKIKVCKIANFLGKMEIPYAGKKFKWNNNIVKMKELDNYIAVLSIDKESVHIRIANTSYDDTDVTWKLHYSFPAYLIDSTPNEISKYKDKKLSEFVMDATKEAKDYQKELKLEL